MLDGIQDWSIEDKVASFERDGVLAKLKALAPNVRDWETRTTRAAYDKGFAAGVRGDGIEDSPYMGKRASNFMRGANDPRTAWQEGRSDGERIRRLLSDAHDVTGIKFSELKLLPASIQERALAGQNARDAAEAAGLKRTTVHCPKCHSTEIREKNVAYALLPVTEWDVSGNHPTPAGYDTDVDVEWTSDDQQVSQYVCRGHDCDWEGSLEDLRFGGLDIGPALNCTEN